MRLSASARLKGYQVYRRLVPWPLLRLRDVDIRSNPCDPSIAELFTHLLTRQDPVFIGRIGGSDWDAVRSYFDDPRVYEDPSLYEAATQRVRELNGYFDFADDYSNFIDYLEGLASFYKRADCLLYCNEGLITKFRYNVFQKKDMRLLRHVCPGKTLIDYTFIEAVTPFLSTFKTWGEGKRVLIVSPFSRSLQFQYARRNELLVDYEFPEFELVTYNSPVTYNSVDDTGDTLRVSSSNWHEQCQRMADEISALDFDIAWLSCASYGMFLGDFIRNKLGRKAIYTGGILNVLFNIYGQRYDASLEVLTRPETRIDALENEDVMSLRGGRGHANEALRAYFGHRAP